jgi:tetratricopeptide (TPR) repeat protein
MKSTTEPIDNGFPEARFEFAVSMFATAFLLAHLIASFFPTGRTWGFHHWIFYPLPLRFLFLAGILLCLPAVRRYMAKLIWPVLSKGPLQITLNRYVLALILTLTLSPIFYLLRTSTHFLGDGYIIVRSISIGNILLWAEPLDSFLHEVLYTYLHTPLGLTGEMVYAITSCFMGACFLFVSALCVGSFSRDPGKKAFLFLSLLSMGSIQLFFGYVESYTILMVEILVYLFVSLRYLQNRGSIFLPSLLFSLTVCTHLSGVILFPSLLYLYASRLKTWDHWKKPLFSSCAMLIGAAIPVLLLLLCVVQTNVELKEAWGDITKGSHVLPLTAPHDDPQSSRYGLLSLTHLMNLFNEIVLIAPIALLLGPASFIAYRRKRIFRDQISLFLLIASGACLVYLFLFKPDKGASRDWDLFAMCSVPWTLYAAYLFSTAPIRKDRYGRIGVVLLITALLHTGPWILTNSDVERALERFQVLTEKDGSWSNVALADAYEELSTFSRARGLEDQRIEYCKKAVSAMPTSRYYNKLGVAYGENGLYEKSIAILKKVGDHSIYAVDTHFNMGVSYLKLNRIDEAAAQFQKTLIFDPTHIRARFNIAVYYAKTNRVEEAIAELQKVLQLDPHHEEARQALERLNDIEHGK